jgi:hypothetical protein
MMNECIKTFTAFSRVKAELKTNVSEIFSVSIIMLMTLVYSRTLRIVYKRIEIGLRHAWTRTTTTYHNEITGMDKI